MIHYAAALNLSEVIDFLIEAGCVGNAKVVGTNITPMIIAAVHNHAEVYKVIKANGFFIFEDENSDNEDAFAEMLMREFPHKNLKIE